MKAASEEASKLGATPNSDESGQFGAAPNSEEDQIRLAEEKAIECLNAFEKTELEHRSLGEACHNLGIAFGHAMIDLRDKKKAAGDRDWMAYLKQLGISYDKARHWIAKVEGKPTDRHKAGSAGSPKEQQQQQQLDDWDTAVARLEKLKHEVFMLKQSQPVGAGCLVGPLASLADLLGYELKAKGGSNA